jgi:acyl-CoA synthetase (NDP forming)
MTRAPDLFDALFRPRAVALVGASADAAKNTARPLRYLDAHGARARVYPVNPSRDEVLGHPAFASVAELPRGVEHALVMVPAPAVAGVIEQCGERGIAVATVYSDGYAEAGAGGARRQGALVELARRCGVRVLGPNSMGVVSVPERLALTVNAALEAPELLAGSTALVSQSGTMIGAMLSRAQARGFGFSRMVSIGNEADIGVAELVALLACDPQTETIVLFLETIRDPAGLGRAARVAFDAGKRVVAYKLGRSAAGQALARSHSGAITGSAAAASAFFVEHGIVEVDVLEALFEIPPFLAGRSPPSGAPRVAVITTTGGGAATVADRLGVLGVDLAGTPAPVAEALRAEGLVPGAGPIIDLTMAGARPGIYGRVLEALLAAGGCGAVVAVIGSSAQFHPEIAVRGIAGAPRSTTPIAAFPVPEAGDSLRLLGEAGIAAFRTPEACAEAVRAFLAWRAPREVSADEAPPLLVRLLAEQPVGTWGEDSAGGLVEALGIPRPQARVVDADGPFTDDLPWPVAVKALGDGLEHKSELGAVELEVGDPEALRAAIGRIHERLGRGPTEASVDRFLVQPMVRGVAEVLIAYRRDPEVGPTITVGAGGVLAEVRADAVLRIAPVDVDEAREMIDSVRTLTVLGGYRGLPAGDRRALAEAVAALSRLAAPGLEAIAEAEINPLIVCREGEGVAAVDALVVAGSAMEERT